MIIIWLMTLMLCFGIALSGVNNIPPNTKHYTNGRRMSSSTYCGMKFRRSVKRRMRRW